MLGDYGGVKSRPDARGADKSEIRVAIKQSRLLRAGSRLEARDCNRCRCVVRFIKYADKVHRIFSSRDEEPCPYPLIAVINRKNRLLRFYYSRHAQQKRAAAGWLQRQHEHVPITIVQ